MNIVFRFLPTVSKFNLLELLNAPKWDDLPAEQKEGYNRETINIWLMVNETLDELLSYFYNKSSDYHYFYEIKKAFEPLKNDHPIKLVTYLTKLKEDRFILEDIEKSIGSKSGTTTEDEIYYISMEGILFYESTSKDYEGKPYQYSQELKRKKDAALMIETFPKRYWWVIAIVAWGIGLLTDFIKQRYTGETQRKSIQQQALPTLSDSSSSYKRGR
jgi:hypothetical protein